MADKYQPAHWVPGAGGIGYYMCAHRGCTKKVRTDALGHDCCGHSSHSFEHQRDANPPQPQQPEVTLGDAAAAVGGLLRRAFGKRR